MTVDQSSHNGTHLVILHHGLWGHAGHVKFIANEFKKRLGDRLVIYRAQANESELTYDGVDICGQRLVREVHEVVKVIESGGNIDEMRGKKHKKKSTKLDETTKKTDQKPPLSSDLGGSTIVNNSGSSNSSTQDLSSESTVDLDGRAGPKNKKVTQFSYLGYSLGGLIGRFAMGMLAEEGFFDHVEPVYFVTMATPHLGIRQPPLTNFSKLFNYLSSRMLSRTGEQLQLIDDYLDGQPVLLVMSEPAGIFMQALARFKRRAIYCNIRNDRSVPFWTASFSDADPFSELDLMDIQYTSGYSSVIESFEQRDLDTIARLEEEKQAALKAASFMHRTTYRLQSIPWKKYALFGFLGPILIPIWIIIATSTISVQGIKSRRRTKDLVQSSTELARIREKVSTVQISRLVLVQGVSSEQNQSEQSEQNEPNTSHEDDGNGEGSTVVMVTDDAVNKQASTDSVVETVADSEPASFSYPNLKTLRPLPLAPVQVEISRKLNQLEWRKNIIHIEAFNAHASIVVREKRFSHDGGVAAVQHAVDMFKGDGEDE
ncbi:hypothetical protein BG004_003277 [Podila humilis]|nr:hypothetical protein BG004_003277 [Podila humilis]